MKSPTAACCRRVSTTCFDRQTLSVLKPAIKAEFGLDDSDCADIVTVLITYMVAYTLGGLIGNQLIGHFVGSLGFTPVFLVLGVLHLLAAAILVKLISSDHSAPRVT